MQVYDISITFRRSRQPRDYENATAEIACKASVEEGEDWTDAAQEAMANAQILVYEALGMPEAASRVSGKTAPALRQQAEQGPQQAPPANQGDKPLPTRKTVEKAHELGVDLSQVEGTGKDGRVTQADVERHHRMSAPTASADPDPAEFDENVYDDGAPEDNADGSKDDATFPDDGEDDSIPDAQVVPEDRELQRLAGEVARKLGSPKAVMGKINELGAARLAELTDPNKIALHKWLQDQSAKAKS